MKLMIGLNLSYYLCLLVYIMSIPQDSFDSYILKLILFILCLGTFVLLIYSYIIISFNKKIKSIKHFFNLTLSLMCIGTVLLLILGPEIYKKTNSIVMLMGICIVLLIASNVLFFKIQKITEIFKLDFIQETKIIYKMGKAIDKTPLNNAITKLDYLFLAYCIAYFNVGNIYIFVCIIGIILILSTKYLKIIKTDFLNSGLISVKETYLSLISYYFCYIFSIIYAIFIQNVSVLLVGGASLLAIKIFIRRIAEKLYEEKNSIS